MTVTRFDKERVIIAKYECFGDIISTPSALLFTDCDEAEGPWLILAMLNGIVVEALKVRISPGWKWEPLCN